MLVLDILIVDAKSDLNAYVTVSRDDGSCCGPAASVPCCGASSQTSKASMETLAKTMVEESGVTDFNEWAGRCTTVKLQKKKQSSPSVAHLLTGHFHQGHSRSMPLSLRARLMPIPPILSRLVVRDNRVAKVVCSLAYFNAA